MEFNQKFDRAPILALQDGKSDNIFLLSLSLWLLNLGRHYHVWDLKQQEDYCSVSLQFLETTGWKTLKQMWKFIRKTICPIIQTQREGPEIKHIFINVDKYSWQSLSKLGRS